MKDDPDIYFIDDDEKIEVNFTQFNGNIKVKIRSGG